MNLRELVAGALRKGGFDGLAHPDLECGCLLKDLMPCDEPSPECVPGRKVLCPEDCGDHNFHIRIAPRTVTLAEARAQAQATDAEISKAYADELAKGAEEQADV